MIRSRQEVSRGVAVVQAAVAGELLREAAHKGVAMGFWTWLTGKHSRVTTIDRIWMTRPVRCRAVCPELQEHLSKAQLVILLAHFPATLPR